MSENAIGRAAVVASSKPVASTSQRVLQRKCACGRHTVGGGECEECKRKGRKAQRKARHTSDEMAGATVADDVLRAPGQPLDGRTRAFMERRLGHDFSGVRLHTDASAADSAANVGAEAYTVGRDIVFGAGYYAPQSRSGRELLAHELTHVVQQSRGFSAEVGASRGLRVGPSDDGFEREADRVAAGIHGHPSSSPGAQLRGLTTGAPVSVQRKQSAGGKHIVSRGKAIVEDGRPLAPGQMHRTQFLTTLRDVLLKEVEIEMAPVGRTSRNCPYIMRTLERYANRPVASLLHFIRKFAKPPAGADAQGLIHAVAQQSRRLARRVAEKSPKVQASTVEGGVLPVHDPLAIQAELHGGHPLDAPARQRMEASFGTSFSGVRVHDDAIADGINSRLRARAFAVGNHIAFANGQYRPGTPSGDMLLAHELAHTIQQGSGRARAGGGREDRELERGADRAAMAAVAGQRGVGTTISPDTGLRVQRGPVVLAGALLVGEVGVDAVVVGEVAAVSTELVVADGAIVATTEIAAPLVLETAAPVALETVAPVAIETVAPVATDAVVTSSAVSTTATAVGVGAAATTLSSDSPTSQEEDKKRRCRSEPCPTPLPISWPVQLPLPTTTPRLLMRVTSVEREWEGIDRAAEQSRLSREIRRARERLVPPPQPCFDNDAEPNAPYDAHHVHPLYLNGEEAEWNLCALRADLHQRGHPSLNNQTAHLEEYRECGICSGYLSHHPVGQQYVIIASKG
jgi:hypothetical protein